MDIDIAQADPHQAMILHELHHFFVCRHKSSGKGLEKGEDFFPVAKVAAGKLSDDERMTSYLAFFEKRHEMRIALPKMDGPN